MHQRQGRHGQRVAQILVKAADLRRQQEPLVNHRAGRKGRHVELGQARQPVLRAERHDAVQRLLADRQDFALKGVLIGQRRIGGDNRLANYRHRLDHPRAEPLRIGGHLAPAEQRLALDFDEMLHMTDGELARRLVARQKAHRDRVMSERRQAQVSAFRPIAQQRIRHLDQAAGTVADQRIGADRAAMVEVDQDFQAARDDVVRFSPLDVGDETDAAGIVLVARIVKSLSFGHGHHGCSSPEIV